MNKDSDILYKRMNQNYERFPYFENADKNEKIEKRVNHKKSRFFTPNEKENVEQQKNKIKTKSIYFPTKQYLYKLCVFQLDFR